MVTTVNKSNNNTPVPYFLVNPNGLEEVREFQKDLHSTVETLQQKMEELKETIPLEKRLFTLQEAAKYLAVSESTVARGLMICPTTPIDGTRLDKYQRQHPLLVSTFYFYYIEWYVSHYNEIYAEIYERLTKFRETTSGIHPRLRETQFCLHIAYMLFLKFCEDSGFITTNEGQKEYISFGSQLVELVKAQNARIWADDKKSEDVDYLKLIRKLYKSNSFRLADSVEQFDRNKHDGVIHYECLCLRRESLEKRIRKIFHGARINDVINALLAQGALKLVEKKNSVQISGLPKPRPRLYCIWLDMLD